MSQTITTRHAAGIALRTPNAVLVRREEVQGFKSVAAWTVSTEDEDGDIPVHPMVAQGLIKGQYVEETYRDGDPKTYMITQYDLTDRGQDWVRHL